MSYKGSLINDKYVVFGGALTDKTREAINRGCPSGSDIIRSLPESAFIPVQEEVIVKEVKPNRTVEKRKARLQKKKEIAAKKAAIMQFQEPTIIEKMIQEKQNMSLDIELDSILEEAKPKVQEEVVEEPEVISKESSSDTMRQQILGLLASDENAPSLEEIDAWKEKYGKNGIHVMSFGDNDNYIYHHLTRGEWKKIKEVMKKLRDSENAEELEEKLKEKVVCGCIIWPQADSDWLETSKAGVVDSLYQMILLNSGFLTPQQAMLLTTQL